MNAMLTRSYTIRFVTPAFLGNAEQSGQWRTPPIKALIRQWWRLVYAADSGATLDVAAMRSAEGQLFGVAADGEGSSRKSRVRIRLDAWSPGQLRSWDGLEQGTVHHRESERTGYKVGPHAYLGYGPLDGRGGTDFSDKCNAAIKHGESAFLKLAFPGGEEAPRLDTALSLLHRYGTLGGRSRNGWGSFSLTPADDVTPSFGAGLDARLTAPWQDALRLDWPHAIGRDATGPLIWQTEALADWRAVMRRLAELKIGLRTQFVFPDIRPPHLEPLDRHWLSYPVTNHKVSGWERSNLRLPNSLRFKVRADGDGKLRGVVFHMPCLPPPKFNPDRGAIANVWRRVHEFLDQPAQKLERIPA